VLCGIGAQGAFCLPSFPERGRHEDLVSIDDSHERRVRLRTYSVSWRIDRDWLVVTGDLARVTSIRYGDDGALAALFGRHKI
jgi:hypothetical protein